MPSLLSLLLPKHPSIGSTSKSPFEELSRIFSFDPVEKFLQDSKIDKLNVYEIVFVGGSIRIPHIVKLVSDFFNSKKPDKSTNPMRLSLMVLQSNLPSSPARPMRGVRFFLTFPLFSTESKLLELSWSLLSSVAPPSPPKNPKISPLTLTTNLACLYEESVLASRTMTC